MKKGVTIGVMVAKDIRMKEYTKKLFNLHS